MDTAAGSLIAIVVLAAALWFGFRWLVRSSSRYRGTRIVTCPETKKPAIVEVDSLHASLTSTVGLPDIRLEECSRWPIKEQCGQECLLDLDSSVPRQPRQAVARMTVTLTKNTAAIPKQIE
jgi:hypothetical protein